MMTPLRCADGVVRSTLGQWQGYLSAAAGDPDEAARRLEEVPPDIRPLVDEHWRSTRVVHWVYEVLLCPTLHSRRAMLQQCPPELRDDVRDQVAVLFDLRRRKTLAPPR